MNDEDVIAIERSLGWRQFAEILEHNLSTTPCDHTFRFTEAILAPLGIWESMILWLTINGVACDCCVVRWLSSWIDFLGQNFNGRAPTLARALGDDDDGIPF